MDNTLTLIKTVYEINQLELVAAPQIILAGRSNVGKSSLINCLASRKKLAKISSTPGKTRSLNYYEVEPHGYYIVDLPGYGYAKCSKTERAKWGKLIDRYLQDNAYIAAAAVLLDSRLTPQKNDIEMISYFKHCNVPILPIMTKSDKTKQRERAKVQSQWEDILKVKPLCVSSKSGMNRTNLWNLLDRTAIPELAETASTKTETTE
ncbi:ribosome biogenesis GTP-binding protein YihA/YsxC [Maridesulfovibrio hydrothermalis]|uniref:Probable GTP-binding protein EngB n=1 Tax=Maridesulfovibrio hydrothermalis AM13 = DSM 14728 TaxID=1121451 RepID=L0REK5_9BACT|nr:ribosome biogenesis GTP-binding protein YihA/YsxC [Maridesulfovibrio hydrothermalis]CCO24642.1 putative GTP-binding protein EngB [Maridesulfovibrio hydrothermalis AM13 = DSM 14728]